MMLLYLQVVVSNYTQKRYNGVQYSQTAECWGHVTRALLQDKVLKSSFIFLLHSATSTIPGVFII